MRYKLLVKADPKPYDVQHIPDVLKVEGFVSAERFQLATEQMSDAAPSHQYLAIYEIETDDLAKTLEAFRREHPKMVQSPALEPANVTTEIFVLRAAE
jgi:hypothetical protein